MQLGPVDLKRTVKSLSLPSGATYASHEIIGGVPKRQLVGFEPADVTLKCHWHQAIIDINATQRALEELKENSDTVLLQFANGDTWGPYLVMRITLTPTAMLPDETIIACDVDISLGDPGSLGDEDTAPAPVATTGASGAKTDDPTEDRSTAPSDVTPQQIARR